MPIIDIAGQKFGRLLALYQEGVSKDRQIVWNCLCDCGTVTITKSRNLREGRTKSCGCLNKELSSQRLKKVKPQSPKLKCKRGHDTSKLEQRTKNRTCKLCHNRVPRSIARKYRRYKTNLTNRIIAKEAKLATLERE